MNEKAEMTAIERAADVTRFLMQGGRLWASDVADLYGLSERYAQCFMKYLSRVIPIYENDDHAWIWLKAENSH